MERLRKVLPPLTQADPSQDPQRSCIRDVCLRCCPGACAGPGASHKLASIELASTEPYQKSTPGCSPLSWALQAPRATHQKAVLLWLCSVGRCTATTPSPCGVVYDGERDPRAHCLSTQDQPQPGLTMTSEHCPAPCQRVGDPTTLVPTTKGADHEPDQPLAERHDTQAPAPSTDGSPL